MSGKPKKTVSEEYKKKLIAEIAYYDKRIEEELNKRKPNFFEDESFEENIRNPYKFKIQPSLNELNQQEASLSARASMTLELNMLTIIQSEINVMVTPPKVSKPIDEAGVWQEVNAECKIDLVSFTIAFFAHKPVRKFAPTRYRNVAVTLGKSAHQKELAESILPKLQQPNLAFQVLQSYAKAVRSRRTTLLELAARYEDKLQMQPMPEGGYRVRFLDLVQLDWTLENQWSPVAPFYHHMKFALEYMPKDYLSAISKLYKKFKDPSLETSERTAILSQIFDICLEAAGPAKQIQDDLESNPETAGSLHERRTTIDEEPDVPHIEHPPKKPSGKENTAQNRKTDMAPPKTIPKKAKKSKPNQAKTESQKRVKRTNESDDGNVKRSRNDDNDDSRAKKSRYDDNDDSNAKRSRNYDNDDSSAKKSRNDDNDDSNAKKSRNDNNDIGHSSSRGGLKGGSAVQDRGESVGLKANGQKTDGKQPMNIEREMGLGRKQPKKSSSKVTAKTAKEPVQNTVDEDDAAGNGDGKILKSKTASNNGVVGIININKNGGSSKDSSEASSKMSKKNSVNNVTTNTLNTAGKSKKGTENSENTQNDKTVSKHTVNQKEQNIIENDIVSAQNAENKGNTQNDKPIGKSNVKSKENNAVSSKNTETTTGVNNDNKKVGRSKKDKANVGNSKRVTKKTEDSDDVTSKVENAVSDLGIPKTRTKYTKNNDEEENATNLKHIPKKSRNDDNHDSSAKRSSNDDNDDSNAKRSRNDDNDDSSANGSRNDDNDDSNAKKSRNDIGNSNSRAGLKGGSAVQDRGESVGLKANVHKSDGKHHMIVENEIGLGRKEPKKSSSKVTAKTAKEPVKATVDEDDAARKGDGKIPKFNTASNNEVVGTKNTNKNGGSSKDSSEASSNMSKKNTNLKKNDANIQKTAGKSKKGIENSEKTQNQPTQTLSKNTVNQKEQNTKENDIVSAQNAKNRANTQNDKPIAKSNVKSKDKNKENNAVSSKNTETTTNIDNDNKNVGRSKKGDVNVGNSKRVTKKAENSENVTSKVENGVSDLGVPKTRTTYTKNNDEEENATNRKHVNDIETVNKASSETVASQDDGKDKAASKNDKATNEVGKVSKNIAKNVDKNKDAVGKTRSDKTTVVKTSKDKAVKTNVANNETNKNVNKRVKGSDKNKVLPEMQTKNAEMTDKDTEKEKAHLAEKRKVISKTTELKSDQDNDENASDKTFTKAIGNDNEIDRNNEVKAKKGKTTEPATKNIENNDNLTKKYANNTEKPKNSPKPTTNTARILKETTNRDETIQKPVVNNKTTQNTNKMNKKNNMLNITKTISVSKIPAEKQIKIADKLKTKIPMMKSKITFSSLSNKLGNVGKNSTVKKSKIPQMSFPVSKTFDKNLPKRISPRKLPTTHFLLKDIRTSK